jgi:hypothetical protein
MAPGVCFANRLGTLRNKTTPVGGQDKLSVETCISACHNGGFLQGGVGNNTCCTCFTCLFDEHSSTDQTSLLKTVIMIRTVGPRQIK